MINIYKVKILHETQIEGIQEEALRILKQTFIELECNKWSQLPSPN